MGRNHPQGAVMRNTTAFYLLVINGMFANLNTALKIAKWAFALLGRI